jgi:mono/diheme cytochrome c family protein
MGHATRSAPLCLAFLLALLGTSASCTSRPAGVISSPSRATIGSGLHESSRGPFGSDWEKRRWIDKAARKLRLGRGIAPGEMDALAALEPEQVVRKLMDDPLFPDTILDFNLSFLGMKRDRVRTDTGNYSSAIFHAPNAIAAARAFYDGGDYLARLLQFEQPLYLPPLVKPTPLVPGDETLDPEVLRALNFQRVLDWFDRALSAAQAAPDAASAIVAGCREVKNAGLGYAFYYTGYGTTVTIWLGQDRDFLGQISEICGMPTPPAFDLIGALRSARAKVELLRSQVDAWLPKNYTVRDLRDLRALDLKPLQLSVPWSMFDVVNGIGLANSSTNYNRRRAAFVLGRFFCDDLTPINVTASDDHAAGAHASDPSCQSCHYKLDPMAGFFRSLGIQFQSFAGMKTLRFDDLSVVDREQYESAWKAPAGSPRTWQVGYVRSTDYDQLNDYGSDLPDLFAIIRKAPETRRCLNRRLFEYFVADNQAVDAGYLDYLTQEFNRTAATDSVQAVRETVSRLVLSRSFSETDPVGDRCYDYAPGTDPTGLPPCKVAYLLEKNCRTCHSPASMKGGLDLTRWVTLPDGKPGFIHLDASQKQRTRRETFEAMVNRLDTPDPAQRMPLKKYMSSADREAIYLWSTQTLGGLR